MGKWNLFLQPCESGLPCDWFDQQVWWKLPCQFWVLRLRESMISTFFLLKCFLLESGLSHIMHPSQLSQLTGVNCQPYEWAILESSPFYFQITTAPGTEAIWLNGLGDTKKEPPGWDQSIHWTVRDNIELFSTTIYYGWFVIQQYKTEIEVKWEDTGKVLL